MGVVTASEAGEIEPFSGLRPRVHGWCAGWSARVPTHPGQAGPGACPSLIECSCRILAHQPDRAPARAPVQDLEVRCRPRHRRPRPRTRPPASQALRARDGPHRRRPARPHPRLSSRHFQQELPVLDQPPGRHRRRHPTGRRPGHPAAGRPRRPRSLRRVPSRARLPQRRRHRRRRLHRRLGDHHAPPPRRSTWPGKSSAALRTGTSGPASSTRSRGHEDLEDPARLPPVPRGRRGRAERHRPRRPNHSEPLHTSARPATPTTDKETTSRRRVRRGHRRGCPYSNTRSAPRPSPPARR